jgi:hypothetical protein
MPPVPGPGQLVRTISFFRADCGTDDDGAPITFRPRRMLEHIDGLAFDNAGRYYQFDGNIYCAWVDRPESPARLRFAVIRREGLPFVEQAGVLSALNIPAAAGLVEQIHVEVFPNNIVGCESNFYGPRLPRLRSYLRERGGPEKQDVAFEPLIRQDVLAALQSFDGIRVFQFRVRRADIDLIAQADRSLADALAAQAALGSAEEFEVVLRPKAYSRDTDLGSKMLNLVRKLANRGEVLDAAKSFRVVGRVDGGPSQELNILDERLTSPQLVAKEPGRGRAVHSDSAYAAVRAAERELRDELAAAAAVAAARQADR